MGCGCKENNNIILSDMKEVNIDQKISELYANGFDVNRIAAMLLVNKEYVESSLAPKPQVKTSKKQKSE
jgi:hypothetical protein